MKSDAEAKKAIQDAVTETVGPERPEAVETIPQSEAIKRCLLLILTSQATIAKQLQGLAHLLGPLAEGKQKLEPEYSCDVGPTMAAGHGPKIGIATADQVKNFTKKSN